MLGKRLLALALSLSVALAAKTANNTISLGDGTTTTTNATTTVYLGTEYNPAKCSLQFASLKCKSNKDCSDLNGYQLECKKLGMQDGSLKTQCACPGNVTEVCQNSTSPLSTGVPQFGECGDDKPCADSFGHVPTSLEIRVCAEKIHCVKEINTTASVPAQICHTCRSCIAQNNAGNKTLDDKRRFDCTTICPPEVLESIAKRNRQGVGIADEVSSTSGSESAGSESTSGSVNTSSQTGSKGGKKSGATKVDVPTLVVGLVVAVVGMAAY